MSGQFLSDHDVDFTHGVLWWRLVICVSMVSGGILGVL